MLQINNLTLIMPQLLLNTNSFYLLPLLHTCNLIEGFGGTPEILHNKSLFDRKMVKVKIPRTLLLLVTN